ncbi:MAG TPA: DUF4450 domain-containing protein [Paludibacteraceae bacterium]|nr:DUF4450 domain-containing protein [Paludibacteraceae bacterium]
MKNKIITAITCLLISVLQLAYSQSVYTINEGKHRQERYLRYTPDGRDFVIVNGKNKFNRALYGGNTGFRLETGDVPEFAFYLPLMGGNLTFSITKGTKTIQLNEAEKIESRYRPGKRMYIISDPVLGKGKITIEALALYETEGAVWKITKENVSGNILLQWRFGGASFTRFSREGDMGVDPPDGFELKPQYCKGNIFKIEKNSFHLTFGPGNKENLFGVFPDNSKLSTDELPALNGSVKLKEEQYIYIGRKNDISQNGLKTRFEGAETTRSELASRIVINTPDPYLNTIGGALAVAADAIWDGKVWLHGAVGWRMQLTGWRAAYTGDCLGWHDRARTHFDNYAASQVTNVPLIVPHPAQDSVLNLARSEKKWGTPQYSNGYICRNPNRADQMHHYDMNLCYIDELLWHLNWTGDLDYVRKVWPVITRHLAWEKLNYDPDNDGLYDAYACIWASDALYYNSGAVTHATAYNYRANRMAALIAEKIGENPFPYLQETEKIGKALETTLWLSSKGHWAEYKDFMGLKRLHESAAVWTVYHAIDSEVGDEFQWYQATQYIDREIPHIPVKAKGLEDEGYQTISTTNWLPYSWSINNVAFAEVMHTSLAYFQAGRYENGFQLLKSSILDGMYLGGSPGNFGQISFYDAARGESYRDFGDPIGVASRVFVQGLYGITPDAMNRKLVIKPGFPRNWNFAQLTTPDVSFDFKRTMNEGALDTYLIKSNLENIDSLELQLPAPSDRIVGITANGKKTAWKIKPKSIDQPVIIIRLPIKKGIFVELKIDWSGEKINTDNSAKKTFRTGDELSFESRNQIVDFYDPQRVLENPSIVDSKRLKGQIVGKHEFHTIFIQLKSGEMTWWHPVEIKMEKERKADTRNFAHVISGKCEPVDMNQLFNSSVTDIFKNQYLSPRSPYTTLQLPVQGIGEWCHPKMTAVIDDSGLRKIIRDNLLKTPLGVNFRTPEAGKNIAFTSRWDNYPDQLDIPLSGYATHAYLLMAGSTNHMQSRIENGSVTVYYKDGSLDNMDLVNPDNWCPIEQDYYEDDLAFEIEGERPYRLQLNSGLVSNNLERDLKIKGVYGRPIEGGAGVLLDMRLNPGKELSHITLRTLSNDVVIGIMAVTLQRP